jgi:hypothetical protein
MWNRADATEKESNRYPSKESVDLRRASSEVAPEHHSKVNDVLSPPTLLLACHPNGKIDLDALEGSAAKTMELYNKLVAIITGWLDKLDASTLSTADGFTAFRLLAPTLESLTLLRIKIGEQRGAEARDATAQAAPPKIAETLELLRSRFNDIKKPKAT